MTSKSKASLSRDQKIMIQMVFACRVCFHKKASAAGLASRTKPEFSLHIFPGIITVRGDLLYKKLTKTDAGRSFKATCVNSAANEESEEYLYNWIWYQHDNRGNLNGDTAKAQAQKFQDSYKAFIAEHKNYLLNFWNESWPASHAVLY